VRLSAQGLADELRHDTAVADAAFLDRRCLKMQRSCSPYRKMSLIAKYASIVSTCFVVDGPRSVGLRCPSIPRAADARSGRRRPRMSCDEEPAILFLRQLEQGMTRGRAGEEVSRGSSR